MLYRIAAAGRDQKHACRNLHSLVHKRGLTLPLRLHTVKVPVRKRKPKVHKQWVHYPVILPRTWVEYLLLEHSELLLAGHHISDVGGWKTELRLFWDRYLKANPSHPMAMAIQPAISFRGPEFKNSSGPPGFA